MTRQAASAIISVLLWMLWCPAAPADSASSPRIDYVLHCQGCHLADGSGTAGKVPALKHQVGRFVQVPGGREYLIRVPGSSQAALTDAQVAAVLNWILENFSAAELPAGFTPYSTEEVSRLRRPPLADVSEVRARLLAEISAGDVPAAGE